MKQTVIAVATLMLILLFASGGVFYVEEVVEHTVKLVEQAGSLVGTEHAETAIEQAEHYWKTHESFFGALLQHDEVDNVVDTFAQLKAYAGRGDWDDYCGNCAALLARLEHISAKERPILQNIM